MAATDRHSAVTPMIVDETLAVWKLIALSGGARFDMIAGYHIGALGIGFGSWLVCDDRHRAKVGQSYMLRKAHHLEMETREKKQSVTSLISRRALPADWTKQGSCAS